MQSGTGADLNTKQGEVFMAIELLNWKMIQGYVHCYLFSWDVNK